MNRKTRPDRPVIKVVSLAVAFSAMLGLSSCGGGGGGGGDGGGGGSTVITPPSRVYGAYDYGSLGYCSDGWSIGVATGYSSASAAASAATSECRRGGSSDCDGDVGRFGSAYEDSCMAVWSGRRGDGGCRIDNEHGKTLTAARTAALSECQSQYSSCTIEVSECSISGPADSFYRIARPGDGGGGNGSGTSGRHFGTMVFSYRGSECSGGYAVGVATGYSSGSSADSAARRQCSNAGGRNCGEAFQQFGTGYDGNNDCGALAYGETNRASDGSYRCDVDFGTGTTRTMAESAALSDCRNGGYNCSIVTSACSTSGPENSFSRTGSGSAGGGNTGGGTGGNRPPVAGSGFRDGSIQEGGTLVYRNLSRQFSDPDGDRLRITASSNATNFATVRVSGDGDTLTITGVQAFRTGAVTITVTATDPGGLTAHTRFAVRVTAAPRQWGYYAITGSSCTGNGRHGWSLNSGYSDQASASRALRSVCNSRGGCPTGNTFVNSCVGVATSERCGYWKIGANSAASAENTAFAACRSAGGTNCRSASRCAGNP